MGLCDEYGIYDIEKKNLTFFCLMAFQDLVRPEAEEAIYQLKRAGIKIKMITGDNALTAKTIAEECGILDSKDNNQSVMEGKEFMEIVGGIVCSSCLTKRCDCPSNLNEVKLLKRPLRKDTLGNSSGFSSLYTKLSVLARTRPEDKLAFLIGLKQQGEIVAVTGDGVNDVLALKNSDVGFSMGISGTEISREASSIILLDDNFKSIVKSIIWGRNIYECIQKYLTFQMTVNISAVINMFIIAVFFQQAMLQPIQLMWVYELFFLN